MKRIAFGILIVALIVGAAIIVVQRRTLAELRAEKESLQKQLEELAAVKAENESLLNRLSQASAPVNEPSIELLKLRGKVGVLNSQIESLNKDLHNATNAVADLQSQNRKLFSA